MTCSQGIVGSPSAISLRAARAASISARSSAAAISRSRSSASIRSRSRAKTPGDTAVFPRLASPAGLVAPSAVSLALRRALRWAIPSLLGLVPLGWEESAPGVQWRFLPWRRSARSRARVADSSHHSLPPLPLPPTPSHHSLPPLPPTTPSHHSLPPLSCPTPSWVSGVASTPQRLKFQAGRLLWPHDRSTACSVPQPRCASARGRCALDVRVARLGWLAGQAEGHLDGVGALGERAGHCQLNDPAHSAGARLLGFPQKYYEVPYDAPVAPELAQGVAGLVGDASTKTPSAASIMAPMCRWSRCSRTPMSPSCSFRCPRST